MHGLLASNPSTQSGSQSTWQGLGGTPVHIAASKLAKTKEKLFIRNVLPNEQREALKTMHTHCRNSVKMMWGQVSLLDRVSVTECVPKVR